MLNSDRPRRVPFAVAAAGLAALVAAPVFAVIAWYHFDGLYGQDSFGYVDYALGPLTAALHDLRAPPDFFWPPGYPLIVAIVASLTGLGSATGVAVSLICGALTPLFVALLTLEVLPDNAGPRSRYAVPLFAGITIALAGQLWQSSAVAMADTTGVFFATVGAWAAARYANGGRGWLAVVAGAALAAAIETRVLYGAVALSMGAVILAGVVWRYRVDRRGAMFALAGALTAAVVIGAPTLVAIAVAYWAGAPLPFVGEFAVHHWDPLNAFRSSFETADGRLEYGLPSGAFYLLQPVQHYWFAALGVLAIPGLWRALRSITFVSGAVLVIWPAIVVGFLVGDAYQNTRFFLAAAPPFAALIGLGAREVWGLATRVRPEWRATALRASALGLTVALLANGLLAGRFTYVFVDRVTQDARAIRSLAVQLPANARVISLGATPLLEHDGLTDVVELNNLDPASIVALVADGRDSYLLVDIAAMRSQWRDQPPGLAVAALERSGELTPIAAAGIWTLYRIATPISFAAEPAPYPPGRTETVGDQ